MLYKNTLIKIKKSLGRYISLLIIVAVGVGFFAGLEACVPNIINAADRYYSEHNLMDFKINSSMGLTKDDVKALKSLKNVKEVIPSYSLDVLDKKGNAIKVHAIENSINTVNLIRGRMPKNDSECIADYKNYKIGDKIKIASNENGKLKNSQFTVVGTIESPLYIDENYGSTTIGNGKLSSFIFVNKDDFTLNAYTEIYLTAQKYNIAAYSKGYDDISSNINSEINKIKTERETARYNEIYKQTRDSNIKVNWYVFDRSASIGYNNLKTGTETISSVAKVFPIFFMIIVILMTSNTMVRMIEEERGELGTLTSLGYSNKSIISTYLIYVLSATALGVIIGFFVGATIIPKVIYSAFKLLFPPLIISYNISSFLMILCVALVFMAAVTVYFCNKELKQNPATLMRPVPPKSGKTIFLEKVGFIWKHLSFTWKVTMRNIFRYKKRVLMTVIGIAGCTALLVLGFGLRDSINGVAQRQYSEIFTYNDLIVLNGSAESISGNLQQVLNKEGIKNPVLINQTIYKIEKGNTSISPYLIVPENNKKFYKYFNLKNVSDNTGISLNNTGVVVTQRISEAFNIGKGDYITIKDSSDNNSYTIKVSDVTKNYTSNYIYMSKDLYKKVFGKTASYNMITADSNVNEKKLSKDLLESNLVSNVTFKDDILKQASDGNGSMNNVVIVVVVIAALLAIVVLYNLTSINISERNREIATLKVLGFTDKETSEYIYRETIILTLISIAVGLVLGTIFHKVIINMIQGNDVVFFKNVKPFSFLCSALITMAFAIIMQIVTYFKLKEINMIESLKSVE
ncbi:MAG: FtsX-like permease family protein [Clostridium sp.]|nr:FtsX-like permease family protein [Clostridium sp.]